MLIRNLEKIDSFNYINKKPFPYFYMDNFLDEEFANRLQREIIGIEQEKFDRYENPFEKKWTLRDKWDYPENLKIIMNELTDEKFIEKLSEIVGYKLIRDDTRIFWGVHKYEPGDKLDIHVDAGIHPINGLKKQVTLGIYLSYEWDNKNGCELEIWEGENASEIDPKLIKCIDKIEPKFNRMVLFTCNDYSWHGNPNKQIGNSEARRIFLTVSYLSENSEDLNKRPKAFFVKLPLEEENLDKKKLRDLRSDPIKYKEIYRFKLD